jgi:hypothetical protein
MIFNLGLRLVNCTDAYMVIRQLQCVLLAIVNNLKIIIIIIIIILFSLLYLNTIYFFL